MSETPRTGDRVRVTYDAMYAGERYGFRRVEVLDGDGDECEITAPLSATVEVLERADDPSKNEIGTVRREQHADDKTGESYSVWQHTQYQLSETATRSHWLCTHSTHHGNLGEALTHDQVRGMPVIGAAPGTPAAEARDKANACEPARMSVRVPNEPHGLSEHLRQVISERVTVGDKWGAVDTLVHCTLMDRERAESYVEDMSEYQQFLSEHGEKPLDNEGIVMGEYYAEKARQRRFRYFTKTQHYVHRITPEGVVQFRHPETGWTPSASATAHLLEREWVEVDVEPIGGAS